MPRNTDEFIDPETLALLREGGNKGSPFVAGRFMRLNIQMSGGTPSTYVELWLTGRDGF